MAWIQNEDSKIELIIGSKRCLEVIEANYTDVCINAGFISAYSDDFITNNTSKSANSSSHKINARKQKQSWFGMF
jgi:hypothetical protein